MNDNTTTEKTVPVEELLLAKPKRVYRTTKSAKQKLPWIMPKTASVTPRQTRQPTSFN